AGARRSLGVRPPAGGLGGLLRPSTSRDVRARGSRDSLGRPRPAGRGPNRDRLVSRGWTLVPSYEPPLAVILSQRRSSEEERAHSGSSWSAGSLGAGRAGGAPPRALKSTLLM